MGNNNSRGFASMSAEKQREIASKGGRAAHEKGTAHQFTSEEAREAGRKGGQASGVSRSKKSEKGMTKPQEKTQRVSAIGQEPDQDEDQPKKDQASSKQDEETISK